MTIRSTAAIASTAAADPYYADTQIRKSWYLQGSSRSDLRIDVESVWEDYSGAGVTVAVLDSQIDYMHTELRDAYDISQDFDFVTGTSDFTVKSKDITDAHGTMVSGVISSKVDNQLGTAGIASGATLVGLAMDYSSNEVVEQALAGLRAASAFDVVNNSWSFTQNFTDDFSKSTNIEMAEALVHTATEGRDGLGTSMVFAAGNMGTSGTANYHNFQNSPYSIAVGAVERDGDAAFFTSVGANVLVSAAGSDVFTTTPGEEFGNTSGTSFAAPAVSAAIALMLEANAGLGYRDIQQILALSARKDGLGDGVKHGNDWVTNGADNHNGGGMHFSDSFGYGFLNVHDAVRMAETWTEEQTAANRTSVGTSVKTSERLIAGENDRIEIELELDQNISIEHVELSMNLSWALTGDLDVWLMSPEGTPVRLVHDLPDLDRVGSIKNFEFSSVASMGEMSEGTWTVVLENNNTTAVSGKGDAISGLLRGVTLEVHGDATDIEDDTYFYTDEFILFDDASELSARNVLSDDNGGTDAVNASAVTYDSVIDLSGKTVTTIGGQQLTLQGGVIENAFSGDGDDVLSGNEKDNLLSAGRGDDVLHLGLGEDTLDGGTGYDVLMVDSIFANISGYLSGAGSFMLGLLNKTMSFVTGIEQYNFLDGTFTATELAEYLQEGATPENPAVPEEPTESEKPQGPVEPEEPAEPVEPEEPAEPEAPVEEPTAETPEDYDTVIMGSSDDDTARGEAGKNWIETGDGDDYLVGKDGDDYLLAGSGDDKVRAGSGVDHILGGSGNDTIMGDAGDDLLEGGDGDDILRGGDGADILIGGAGSDMMQGGDGADIFVFNLSNIAEIDGISDFDASEGDMIYIQGIEGLEDTSFALVRDGRKAILEMTDVDGSTILAEISGKGVDDLTMSQQDIDSLMFF